MCGHTSDIQSTNNLQQQTSTFFYITLKHLKFLRTPCHYYIFAEVKKYDVGVASIGIMFIASL